MEGVLPDTREMCEIILYINGTPVQYAANRMTLAQWAEAQGIESTAGIFLVNGEIVPASRAGVATLVCGDAVEVAGSLGQCLESLQPGAGGH